MDQRGIAWVKADGKRRAEMPVDAFHGNGLVSQLEILRGDLTDVVYEATVADTEHRFGTRITELTQSDPETGGAVTAALSDGTTVHADLVVGADGPHSGVRPCSSPTKRQASPEPNAPPNTPARRPVPARWSANECHWPLSLGE